MTANLKSDEKLMQFLLGMQLMINLLIFFAIKVFGL